MSACVVTPFSDRHLYATRHGPHITTVFEHGFYWPPQCALWRNSQRYIIYTGRWLLSPANCNRKPFTRSITIIEFEFRILLLRRDAPGSWRRCRATNRGRTLSWCDRVRVERGRKIIISTRREWFCDKLEIRRRWRMWRPSHPIEK